MKHPKFRASYSVISTWAGGNWDLAVGMYFKLKKFTTPQMAAGKDLHKEWEKEVKKNKALPEIFGGKKLNNPKAEFKTVVQLEPWLDLVGVIDVLDEPTIYEFKSGKTSSEIHANSIQTGVYGVLATFADVVVDRAEIHHYDQYKKTTDMSIVYLTDKYLNEAHNWLVTFASEMHEYFTANDLYTKFGPNLKND